MSINSAIDTAAAGLRATQAGLAVVRFAGELRGRVREEAQVGDCARDLGIAGEGEGLATIAGLGMGEVVDPGFERRGERFEPGRARAVRQGVPTGRYYRRRTVAGFRGCRSA